MSQARFNVYRINRGFITQKETCGVRHSITDAQALAQKHLDGFLGKWRGEWREYNGNIERGWVSRSGRHGGDYRIENAKRQERIA